MEQVQPWWGHGVKNGLLAGVYTAAAFSMVYAIDKAWMLSPVWYWASMVIYVALMYRAGAAAGGPEFKDWVRTPFLVFVIANLLFYVFFYTLFTFVDPGLYDIQAELLERAGRLKKPEDRESLVMWPGGVLRAYVNSLVGGFVLAAGIAIVLQKR